MNKENTFILRVYCDNGLVNVYSTKGVFFTKGDLDGPVAETIPEQTAGIWGTVSMGLKKDSFTMGLPKNCCI